MIFLFIFLTVLTTTPFILLVGSILECKLKLKRIDLLVWAQRISMFIAIAGTVAFLALCIAGLIDTNLVYSMNKWVSGTFAT